METIFETALLGIFFGTFGTMIGGIVGILFKNPSDKTMSFVLSLAGGLMTSVVAFDLVPDAIEVSGTKNIFEIIIGMILGIATMFFCNTIVKRKNSTKKGRFYSKRNANVKNSHKKWNRIFGDSHSDELCNNSALNTGLVVAIGIALHNIPEGLAIGTGFENSTKLGLSLAIAIAIHDIPEGISMAVPLKKGGMKNSKVLWYVFLSGIATGIGSLVGAFFGEFSGKIIVVALSFAAGAMLYIVSGELTPESCKLYNGNMNSVRKYSGIFATDFLRAGFSC